METWIVFHNTANERNKIHGVAEDIKGVLSLVPVGMERFYRAERWMNAHLVSKLDGRELYGVRRNIENC